MEKNNQESKPNSQEIIVDDKKDSNNKLVIIKISVLVLLTFQLCGHVLFTHYSRGMLKEKYLQSSLVSLMEITKFICSFFLIIGTRENKNVPLPQHLIAVLKEAYIVAPVALIYFIQNFLVYFALANLRAATFTVLNQLKILTTGFFSVFLLNRKLSKPQWGALCLLVVGVVMVKWKNNDDDEIENNWTGVIAAIAMSCLSGLAGVYFEKIVKKKASPMSIWDRNLQLSMFSIVFAFATAFIFDHNFILEEGFFAYWSIYAVMSMLLMAAGGIIVGMVIKYADNVVKCFSVSIAIIIATIFSAIFWDFQITYLFAVGVLFVCVSIFIYNWKWGKKKKVDTTVQDKSTAPVPSQDNTKV